MKFRKSSMVLAGIAALGLLAAQPAAAAVTVIGNGLARSCYQMTKFNLDPHQGVVTCTAALDRQALTPRDRASTYVNRGIQRTRMSDTRGALDDYNTAIAMRPNLAEAYINRGVDFITLKKYKAALADINKGIALGPKKPEIAYYNRAVVDELQGDIHSAYEDYKKALEVNPSFSLAIKQLQRFRVIRRPVGSGT